MVVDNCFENVAAHYLQSLVAQVLGRFDIDQAQTKVGFAGIAVVGIVPTMVVGPFVVAQYWKIDQDAE